MFSRLHMLIPLKYDSKTLRKEQPSGVISLLASAIVQAYALPQISMKAFTWLQESTKHHVTNVLDGKVFQSIVHCN